MSATKRDDDATPPETRLMEIESEPTNGHIPGSPEAQRSLLDRLLKTDDAQSHALMDHESDLARIRDGQTSWQRSIQASVDRLTLAVHNLSKKVTIRNAAPWLQTMLAGAMGGLITAAALAAWVWYSKQ